VIRKRTTFYVPTRFNWGSDTRKNVMTFAKGGIKYFYSREIGIKTEEKDTEIFPVSYRIIAEINKLFG